MSYPNIPNITPEININRDNVTNLLLASIAFEELGLAHLINAEAEKIQAVLGTLLPPLNNIANITLDDLLNINQSVRKTLQDAIKSEMLLQFKLNDIIEIISPPPTIFKNTAIVTGSFNGEVITDSDDAYYHT